MGLNYSVLNSIKFLQKLAFTELVWITKPTEKRGERLTPATLFMKEIWHHAIPRQLYLEGLVTCNFMTITSQRVHKPKYHAPPRIQKAFRVSISDLKPPCFDPWTLRKCGCNPVTTAFAGNRGTPAWVILTVRRKL